MAKYSRFSPSDISFVIIIVLVLVTTFYKRFGECSFVESSETREKFLVRDLPDKQKAADLLEQTGKGLDTLVAHLVKNKEKLKEYSSCIDLLQKRFNSKNLSEGNLDYKYTTYTINKGEKMVFCLRQRKTEELHKKNLVMFVAIHELAHIGSHSSHHTEEFHSNNKFLLKEAIKIGVYKKENFETKPVNYCGVDITHELI